MADKSTKSRQPVGACYSSPGPIYPLPPLVGYHDRDPQSVFPTYPAYSFGRRCKSSTVTCTPGPHAIDDTTMKHIYPSAPRYSVRGRPKDSGVSSNQPVAYQGIETDYAATTRPPRYSIGGRHHEPRYDSGPGRFSKCTAFACRDDKS